jgi:hypothetical protein
MLIRTKVDGSRGNEPDNEITHGSVAPRTLFGIGVKGFRINIDSPWLTKSL